MTPAFFTVGHSTRSVAELAGLLRHLRALGGLRGRRREEGPSPNTYWENPSFRNYADYAGIEAFRAGLDELRALGRAQACAAMAGSMPLRRTSPRPRPWRSCARPLCGLSAERTHLPPLPVSRGPLPLRARQVPA
jgi:hypothetical protein